VSTPESRVKKLLHEELATLAKLYYQDPDDCIYMPPSAVYGRRGEPDFRLTLRGHEVHVEAKAKQGRLSEHQKERIAALRRCGALVFVVKGEDEAANFLFDHLPEVRQHIGSTLDNADERAELYHQNLWGKGRRRVEQRKTQFQKATEK